MNNLFDQAENPSRRRLIEMLGIGLCSLPLVGHASSVGGPAGAPKPVPPLTQLNRFPRMVQEYYVRRLREIEQAGNARRADITTLTAAEAYVREVREKIQSSFGPWPEKTPLNPRVTGVVERDVYRIEKVIFESRPGFFVTANLYLPKLSGKRPAVLGTCGHSDNGKGHKAYQSFCQGLARLGYVVLIFDPIGQGERSQYSAPERPGGMAVGSGQHMRIGRQQQLIGEFFGSWRAWDGIRAIDYLLTRPEVDPAHLGVTGNSGGGTMTTWLAGVDRRVTMAAPGCFVTTFRRNLENEIGADDEQYPPRILALGLDESDFFAALAPNPVILLGQAKDNFDQRGLAEAFSRVQALYRVLGQEKNAALLINDDYHGYSQPLREAMYTFFNRATKISNETKEPELKLEEDQTLWCTASGQVAELKSRPVWSFSREIADRQRDARTRLDGAELARAVAGVLRLPARSGLPEFRILPQLTARRYPRKHANSFAVETEPGIFSLIYQVSDEPVLSQPSRSERPAVLYVPHLSTDAELRDDPWVREILGAETGSAIFGCDVRGVGDSQPNTFLPGVGGDYCYAMHGFMLDSPYVGQKTHDLLRVIDWLAQWGHRELHLVAKGWGTIPATFAALLSPLVTRVTLKNSLTSFGEVAGAEDYRWPVSCFVPGCLKTFDLPDCYSALARKHLRRVEPWNASARMS
ncbi:MAG: hypothetical protein RIQ93_1032 [Verrucomicrobiota bacterium]|jgi:cephalosporin-C deacetylase-like acetyl esterase